MFRGFSGGLIDSFSGSGARVRRWVSGCRIELTLGGDEPVDGGVLVLLVRDRV